MLNDTVNFALCIGCEPVKAEADQKGRVRALGKKFFSRCGIWSRPDDFRGESGIRSSRFMGSVVALGLCGGEVQRGEAGQEFRASIEMEADPVTAEVRCQRSKAVCPAGLVYDIEPDSKLHGDPDGFTEVVATLLGRHQRVADSQSR